jgi:hypothetical protein
MPSGEFLVMARDPVSREVMGSEALPGAGHERLADREAD